MKLRVFVAVFPKPGAVEELAGLRARLESELPGLRWAAGVNLHFTLRFFGDLDQDEITRAVDVMNRVAEKTVPFDLELRGVGVFPSWKRPRVLWVGCGGGGATLEALARTLDRGFREAGLGEADKQFVPHLTLGRWRDSAGLDGGRARSICDEVAQVAVFRVTEVGVIQSSLGPGGPTYLPVRVSSLGSSSKRL